MHNVVGPVEVKMSGSGSRVGFCGLWIGIDRELCIRGRDSVEITLKVRRAAGKPRIKITGRSKRFKVTVRSTSRFQLAFRRGDGAQRLDC